MKTKFSGLLILIILAAACAPGSYPESPGVPTQAVAEPPELPAEAVAAPGQFEFGPLPYEQLQIPAAMLQNLCLSPGVDTAGISDCSSLPSAAAPAEENEGSPVVILVVDDFGSPPVWQLPGDKVFEVPANLTVFTTPPSTKDNCVMRPDGQGHFAARGARDTAASGEAGAQAASTPHGELVYARIDQLLWEWGYPQIAYQESAQCSNRKVGLYEGGDGARVLVVGVDTQNYNTQAVSNNIEAAILQFGSKPFWVGDTEVPASNRFVINMSFAILPCDNFNVEFAEVASVNSLRDEISSMTSDVYDPGLQGLLQNLDQNIETMDTSAPADNVLAVADLGSFEGNTLLASTELLGGYPRFWEFYDPSLLNASYEEISKYLQGVLADYFADDALAQHLSCYADREIYPRTVISVAAAGNFSSYPFPFVPALLDSVVSISADYSNLPEVCQDFAGEAATNPGEISADGYVEYDDVCFLGSSFAAPWVSTVMAMLLIDFGTDLCAANPDIIPFYGYAGDYGSWDNLTFMEVFDNYCGGSP